MDTKPKASWEDKKQTAQRHETRDGSDRAIKGFVQETQLNMETSEPEVLSVGKQRTQRTIWKVISSDSSGNGSVKETDTGKYKASGSEVLPLGKENKVRYTKLVALVTLPLTQPKKERQPNYLWKRQAKSTIYKISHSNISVNDLIQRKMAKYFSGTVKLRKYTVYGKWIDTKLCLNLQYLVLRI